MPDDDDITLYLETYGYPTVIILEGAVRISLGWFMPDLDPDEPAYYIDVYIDKKGEDRMFIDTYGHSLDLLVPLKNYGRFNDFGVWMPVKLETLEELLEEAQ